MHSNTIINKLKILTALPLIILFFLFIFFITNSYQTLNNMNGLKEHITQINHIANLMNEIQKERGLSSGYLGSEGKEFKFELMKQRKETDHAFLLFSKNSNRKMFYKEKRKEFMKIRDKIERVALSNIESFNFFTDKIMKLEENYLNIALSIHDRNVKNHLQSYANLSLMKESLGEIRGTLNGIISLEALDEKLLYKAFHAKGVYDISLFRLSAISSKEIKQKLQKITHSENYKKIEKKIDSYANIHLSKIKEDPYFWWNQVTIEVEKLHELENDYLMLINQYVAKKHHDVLFELMINTLIFIPFFILMLWLGLKIKNSILRNISLLNEYKDAIDRSSIVSKTNRKGIITYVNDTFCTTSGYKAKELLGKPHNIIRHPDMSQKAFKEMWQDLLNKKSWKGIVKNKRKNGGSYTVKATISPILNHEGEIEEFIAIRQDITEVITLQEEVEKTQRDMIFKMGEIVEKRDKETKAHVTRVSEYAELLASYYGLSNEKIELLTLAVPMHDIGKVGIPDMILNKSSKLTNKEWETMKTHTTIGYDLFHDSDKPLLIASGIIAHEHHEKYDGSGYPRGLKGEEIHIFGRITALADVFDALRTKREYKEAWEKEKILTYIREESGRSFDPKLVEIFCKHSKEFFKINGYLDE
jgi:PAS domain S-box-containing protein